MSHHGGSAVVALPAAEGPPYHRATVRLWRSLTSLHLLANHFPPLHGLRAIAIVSVLQFHLTRAFVHGGLLAEEHVLTVASRRVWFGMDLFFVLSGFLIGTLLVPTSDGSQRGGLLRFYARRTFRIVPLYWVVLTYIVLTHPLTRAQLDNLFFQYTYLANYIRPVHGRSVMPVAWSLCVEEHFYLLAPLLALVLARLRRAEWRIAALFVLWLSGFAIRYATIASRPVWAHDQMMFVYTWTHTRFDTLVAGVLLAQVVHHYGARIRVFFDHPGRTLALMLVPIGCLVLLLGPLADRLDIANAFAWGTVTSVMYFTLCLFLVCSDGLIARFLSARWFMRFATLGYGMYLVHAPLTLVLVPFARVLQAEWHLSVYVVWFVMLAALVALSAAIAYALHVIVEKPALWLRDGVAG